jgi:hypothetical protein
LPEIALTLVPWAPGTAVGAYPRRSEQMLPDQPPTGTVAQDTRVVAADASLTYPDLSFGDYWAAAPLGDAWRYVAFAVEPLPPVYVTEPDYEQGQAADDARLDAVETRVTALEARDIASYGAKGDLQRVTDAAITTGTALLASAAFTAADASKDIVIPNAGAAFNARGAWAASTAYAIGDTVTRSGETWLAWRASNSTYFNPNDWVLVTGFTRYPLSTTIVSVSGGVATLAASAQATVAGGDAWYGSDDSAAFQAAANAGASVTVRRPRGGAHGYLIRDVRLRSNSRWQVENGTVFRLPGSAAAGSSCFTLREEPNALGPGGVAPSANVSLVSDGLGIFDFRGLKPGVLYKGVFITAVDDYRVEGFKGIGMPDGNVVNTYTEATNGWRAQYGRIGRIRSELGLHYGYGAVQIDACKTVRCYELWSDTGRALNLEADTGTQPQIVEDVTFEGVTNVARNANIASAALGMVAHAGGTIKGVRGTGIYARAGADGVNSGYEAGTTAVMDGIEIGGIDVEGGGRAHAILNPNVSFGHYVVRGARGKGCAALNSTSGFSDPGFAYAAGMEVHDAIISDGAGNGFQACYWDAAQAGAGNNPLGTGTARLFSCRSYSNTGYGLDSRYCQRTELHDCEMTDNPVLKQTLPAVLADCQIGGGANWAASAALSALARDTAVAPRALRLTADGTAANSIALGPVGTNGIPVTPNAWHKFSILTVPNDATALRRGLATIWWYTAAGAFITSTPAPVLAQTAGKLVRSTVVAQAPATAAFATPGVNIQMPGGTNLSAGEVHYGVPLPFGPVAYTTSRQTHAVNVGQGCEVLAFSCAMGGNATARSTGLGVYREFLARDADADAVGLLSLAKTTLAAPGTTVRMKPEYDGAGNLVGAIPVYALGSFT